MTYIAPVTFYGSVILNAHDLSELRPEELSLVRAVGALYEGGLLEAVELQQVATEAVQEERPVFLKGLLGRGSKVETAAKPQEEKTRFCYRSYTVGTGLEECAAKANIRIDSLADQGASHKEIVDYAMFVLWQRAKDCGVKSDAYLRVHDKRSNPESGICDRLEVEFSVTSGLMASLLSRLDSKLNSRARNSD